MHHKEAHAALRSLKLPAASPAVAQTAAASLVALGERIRAHRKSLRVSASSATQVAGTSCVTLHRVERGEPSVTMGVYVNSLVALNLGIDVVALGTSPPTGDGTA